MAKATRTRPLRVLIVDRDRHVRQSLTGLMNLADELEVVGAVGDGASALAEIDLAGPDVVLVDPCLPDLADGFSLMERVSEDWPSIRVVAMSCWDEFKDPVLRSGAAAFVAKAGPPTDFVGAIVAAARHDEKARRARRRADTRVSPHRRLW
ncbi:MAG: response regulator transcription factor [Chloroflexota bacterium]|nr:response regulator transcription factor [Chloroflexota bacterium]